MKSNLIITIFALLVGIAIPTNVLAQTGGTTIQGIDVNSILQGLGLGGLLNGQTGGTGTGTIDGNGTGTPTTQPSGDGTRQPIVENQFTTTTGAALQARSPGLYTRAAIAVQTGEITIPGDADPEPSFFEKIATDVSNTLLNSFSGILASVNTFLGTLSGAGDLGLGGGSSTIPTIPNSATTGQGTTTEIEKAITD